MNGETEAKRRTCAVDPAVVCVCVCVVAFLSSGGVGSRNKAALCLANLSHKCQLAGCYATAAAVDARGAARHARHPHLRGAPRRFTPTPQAGAPTSGLIVRGVTEEAE